MSQAGSNSASGTGPPGVSAPFVNAYLNVPVTDVTGDGTDYTVIFDTVTADSTGSYSSSTGVFTAPISGNYFVTATVTFTSVTTAFTLANVSISTSGPADTDLMTTQNPSKVFNRDGAYSQSITGNIGLAAGETLSIQALVSTSAKTVGIQGAAGGNWTYLNIQWINP